jgi:hypothetical protein
MKRAVARSRYRGFACSPPFDLRYAPATSPRGGASLTLSYIAQICDGAPVMLLLTAPFSIRSNRPEAMPVFFVRTVVQAVQQECPAWR